MAKVTKKNVTKEDAASTSLAVLHISDKAVNAKFGDAVMSLLLGAEQDEAKAKELGKRTEMGRNEAMARMIHVFYNAAKNDENIVPENVFAEGKTAKATLIDQGLLALGVREVVDENLQYSEKWKKYFPPQKSTPAFKKTDKYKNARSTESNVRTRVGKCWEFVLACHQTGSVPDFDETARTLIVHNAPKQIAGPSGTAVLTGAQAEGAQEKASIDAFRRIAQRAAGKEVRTPGKSSDVESQKLRALASEDVFGEQCAAMVTLFRALEGNATENQQRSIESVILAGQEVLGITS